VTDRDALLTAIRAQPGEDTPKLAFADWLDENGDAADREWAALIRVKYPILRNGAIRNAKDDKVRQVVVARCFPPGVPGQKYVFDNENGGPGSVGHTLRINGYDVIGGCRGVSLRHGFVVGLTCGWEYWKRHGWMWVGLNPIEAVNLVTYQIPGLGDLAMPAGVNFYPVWRRGGHRHDGGIPAVLFRRLRGGHGLRALFRGRPDRQYDAAGDARLALSAAALDYAREMAAGMARREAEAMPI
jgi:uncharacterized protein (TIGR02996 family)